MKKRNSYAKVFPFAYCLFIIIELQRFRGITCFFVLFFERKIVNCNFLYSVCCCVENFCRQSFGVTVKWKCDADGV